GVVWWRGWGGGGGGVREGEGFSRPDNQPGLRLCALMQRAECSLHMIAHIRLDDRLSIPRAGDPLRSWKSLDDQRMCALCGRKFKGRQVDICRLPGGKSRLCCPTLGCLSTPHQWRYATPAVPSDPVEARWPRGVGKKQQSRAPESALRMQPCRV